MATSTALVAILCVGFTLTQPSQANGQWSFQCPTANGDFAAFPCTNFFYTCSNGMPYRMPCPAGLVFNDNRKICDWPSNVAGCSKAPPSQPPTSQAPPTQTSTSIPLLMSKLVKAATVEQPFQCPADNGDFPAPVSCAEYFYSCSDRIPYRMPCPTGLMYNDKARTCDWPRNIPGCTA